MAKIANKITELTGNDENTKKAREQFTFLQKMAQAKCAEFEASMKEMLSGSGREKCEIVGNRAIKYYKAQHVDIKIGCDNAIKEAVDSFFKGKSGVKDGFQKLVGCALDALIGNSSIGEYQEEMFFIYPENYAIVRVDVMAYKYTFSEAGIISDCENIFCYTMTKSIVDHTKLSKDELLYFVTQMCRGGKEDGEEEVSLEEVLSFVKELISVWNILDNEVNSSKNGLLTATNDAALTTEDSYVEREEPTPEHIERCNSAESALRLEHVENYMRENKNRKQSVFE